MNNYRVVSRLGITEQSNKKRAVDFCEKFSFESFAVIGENDATVLL